jgi:hypothetical protein
MKPADHPEFFRLPPPEGRSRESSIVLDRQGRFWHEGAEVTHPGMARAFASWISRHPDDGRYVLNNGYDWTYFRVEDTPFFVERLLPAPDGSLLLELSDGTNEPLVPRRLAAGADGALLLPVKDGQFFAKFSRFAQLSLAPHLVAGPDGSISLKLGEVTVELPQVSPEA